MENNLLRISNVISLWCKEVSSHRFVFVTPEELQVWEKFFYAGLEACVPLDQESTLHDSAQHSCPPLPNLFGGKMYLEQITLCQKSAASSKTHNRKREMKGTDDYY